MQHTLGLYLHTCLRVFKNREETITMFNLSTHKLKGPSNFQVHCTTVDWKRTRIHLLVHKGNFSCHLTNKHTKSLDIHLSVLRKIKMIYFLHKISWVFYVSFQVMQICSAKSSTLRHILVWANYTNTLNIPSLTRTSFVQTSPRVSLIPYISDLQAQYALYIRQTHLCKLSTNYQHAC